MAVSFFILLSCLVYGAIALPSASSYLPPPVQAPAVPVPVKNPAAVSGLPTSYLAQNQRVISGRPIAQATGHSVSTLTAQRPIASGTSTKQNVGGRTAAQVSGPPALKRTVQRPIASGAWAKQISSPLVGSGRPISTGRHQSSYRIGAPTASGSRTVGSHAPY